jgi:ATP-dependent Lon protease
VLIPEENRRDLQEIPENIKNDLELIPVRWIDEVLQHALQSMPVPKVQEEPKKESVLAEESASTLPNQTIQTH